MRQVAALAALLLLAAPAVSPLRAADWPGWRGPDQNGVSSETGLASHWSPQGENMVWRAEFIGRSTPVVLDGQVCVIGRVGEGDLRQEVVACFDAENGRRRWEHRLDVYQTAVPFNRVGWASLGADPETGNIYAHGVGGQLICYDRDGALRWSHQLTEEFGRMSGYGGRTQTPIVDGQRLILGFVNAGWGDQAAPRHRYFAFDKRTGELLWVAAPGGFPQDFNTQSVPVVAEAEGQRLLIAGDADGAVYAMKVATGEKVWSFQVSKRAMNSSVLVHGSRVYAGHSEENVDEPTMGRVVCIDGRGKGDVTKTHELWRADELEVGFASPALAAGRLYVIDNSANLRCLDEATGAVLWSYSLGTVGKASPVLADGKLYAPEVNGRFHILEPGKEGVKPLDLDEITIGDGHYAELYGSAAVAYGRIYLSTEGGLFCIGDKSKPFVRPQPSARSAAPVAGQGPAASILAVPGELLLRPGETAPLRVLAFDAKGRPLDSPQASWSLAGLSGTVDPSGRFTPDPGAGYQAGTIEARVGELKTVARVRVVRDLPWAFDFESSEPGKSPAQWVGAAGQFVVAEREGQKVLLKAPRERGLDRATLFMGSPGLRNYTIEADVLGGQKGRRRPDIALIAGGYTLDLQGVHQHVEIRSWVAEKRLTRQAAFAWDPDTWYHMKLSVDVSKDKATVRGKVWPKAEAEPEAWTLTVEDPLPIDGGSPGLEGYTPAEAYYDNIKVTVNP